MSGRIYDVSKGERWRERAREGGKRTKGEWRKIQNDRLQAMKEARED